MAFFALLSSLALSVPAHAFTVQSFHPEGTVKAPRQVRAVFSEPMVPFGSPAQLEPFEVDCSAKGKGLWEDTRTWMYEFEAELGAGEGCRFRAKPGLKSEKGSAWEGKSEFAFDTGGPAVIRPRPYEGSSIEPRPAFLLQLDGEADPASVEQNAYLLLENLPERIPLKLLPAKTLELMRKRGEYYYDYEEEEGAGKKKEFFVALESTRNLPPNTRLQFLWGKGIRSPKGAATSEDQVLAYRTQEDFTASFSCERENADAPCLPIAGMNVRFSASVSRKEAMKAELRAGKVVFKPEQSSKDSTTSYLSFKGPFPPKTKFKLSLPKGLKDELGRPLANAAKFPLEVSTAAYPPLAKFAAVFGILEARDPVLPVTLRAVEAKLGGVQLRGSQIRVGADNVNELLAWMSRLSRKDSSYDQRGSSLLAGTVGTEKFELPKPNGAQAFEVVGIPLKEKGFHVVEVESRLLGKSLLGKNQPMFVAAGALVTNLGVHFKWGSENSLAWVTSLDDGQPVAGARVRAVDCLGKVVWEGKTDAQGAALAEGLPNDSQAAECNGDVYGYGRQLTVIAQKDDDFAFTRTSWDDGIEPWRFHVPYGSGGEDETLAHTVLDRTLFRAGQTVHMKHILREKFLRGIRYRKNEMPKTLVILQSSGKRITMPVQFGAAGTAESEWKIPSDAELGTYELYLTSQTVAARKAGNDDEQEFNRWGKGVYQVGSFRVEEFRLPVMAGSLQWTKSGAVAASELPVDLNVRYLAGGGAGGLSVKLRGRAEKAGAASFPDFENFTFANGGVEPGKRGRGNRGPDPKAERKLPEQELQLDAGGNARAALKGIPLWDEPVRVAVEAEYRDPNGEIQTMGRTTTVYPAGALVGIQPDGWVAQADKVKFKVAVASPEGRPLAGKKVSVRWLSRETYSHRKRIVGGFYAYENYEEVKARGPACSGSTNEKGVLECEGKAPASGNMILVAETEEGGRRSRAHHDLWVASGDDWWFGAENDDRVDLLPEKKAYEPGETARFQARVPFREATVLVTVEREGILDRFVTRLDGKSPVIEVPMKPEYAPNAFLSAFFVRGRVADPKATALVDLARPAHKMGLAQVAVGWQAHRLNVKVVSDRKEFRVREKARVRVAVTRALDGKPAAKGEVTLAAVDEALLELLPNRSWQLLENMMGQRSLKVKTSTAQSRVVGKRHFGLKALPAGGGGGKSPARELFDSLLYWKATLPLNGAGEAEAEIPMNDSLSSFRIVAVATEEADRFGTGETSVQTRQDLMLFPGVAPLARWNDRIRPEVTVRNGSERELRVKVIAKVQGGTLGERELRLAPGASQPVFWELTVPKEGRELAYEFEANAGGDARDLVKFTQMLEAPLRETVTQATLERLEGKLSLPVEQPKNSLPNTGGVGVQLERSLASNLGGVKRYMGDYPYGCLEQQTSRAVALRDSARWDTIAKNLSPYIDGAGLLKYFPQSVEGSDILTSYVLQVTQEANYALPDYALPRLVQGLQGFVTGKHYSAGFRYPAADLAVRKLAAMEALSRYQSFDPAFLGTIQIEPNLWPVHALLNWYNLLLREQKIPDREARLKEAEQILRARLEWRGSVVGFKGETPLWWLMSSGDEEANRLLLTAASQASWTPEIGRLVRGALARQKHGHWDLTTANAWGVLAMERFSERHEKEPVAGKATAELAGVKKEAAFAAQGEGPAFRFAWPAKGKATFNVAHEGGGKPWAFLEARAAVRLAEPIFKGYRLQRTVTPVAQKVKGKWSVGDVYRVSLKIEAPADMTWVAVSDPVPAGASVLGSGLGGSQSLLQKGEEQKGWSWGRYEERSFSGFRAYHEWMPRGSHQVEYTVRLNTAGTFQLPNSRVEAMYSPEMYAEVPNATLTIQP